MEAFSSTMKNAMCDRIMREAYRPYRFQGLDIVISPDRPRMQLSEKVCEVLKPEFIAEMNAWMLDFFGTYNLVEDGQVLKLMDKQVIMNERTYRQLEAHLAAHTLIDSFTLRGAR